MSGNSNFSIPFQLSKVSQVAVAEINADSTTSTGTNLNDSIFAGVGVFARGTPFTPLKVTKSTYLSVLGDPIKPSYGAAFEPMRHLYEAVQQTDGYVVRVVPEDAKFPIIYFSEANSVVASSFGSLAYGADVDLAEGQFLGIYVYDGDPCDSTTRAITITQDKTDASRWQVKLTQTTTLGVTSTLETVTISFDPDAVDDMGRVAYVVDAFESRSKYMRAVCDSDAALAANFVATTALTFTGGTNGTQNTITTTQYAKALAALDKANVNYTAVLGLGVYDSLSLVTLADISRDRRIDMFADVKPALTYAEALDAIADTGLVTTDYTSVCMYHFPFTCKDKWTGSKVAFGLSGAAYAAKARGIKKVSDVGGWHYSPAGEERGTISRASIVPIDATDTPDYDAMVESRLNKVASGTNGAMIIDDALTTYPLDNYLGFQHVSSVMNAITRYFYQLGRTVKHQPDGVTETSIPREMKKILERFYACGAFVAPRDPDTDGTDPYVLQIVQAEFDEWVADWGCCITGTSRRIQGEPSLIK